MSDADIDWNDDAGHGLCPRWCCRHKHSFIFRCVECVIEEQTATAAMIRQKTLVAVDDFGKDVAKEHRDLKEHFGRKPVHSGEGPVPAGSVDRSVAEQVHSDLEGLIRKNEKGE